MALFAAVIITDQALTVAGYSMISLQFAGSAARAQHILDAWRAAHAIDAAWLNTRVDFAFLLVYPPAFALACRELAQRLAGQGAARCGTWLSAAVLACMPLDAIENLALLYMLDHGGNDFAAGLATSCALPKFLLAGAAIVYCGYGTARLRRTPVE